MSEGVGIAGALDTSLCSLDISATLLVLDIDMRIGGEERKRKYFVFTFNAGRHSDHKPCQILLVAVTVEEQTDVAAKAVQRGRPGLTTESSQDWSGHIVLLDLHIVASSAVLITQSWYNTVS